MTSTQTKVSEIDLAASLVEIWERRVQIIVTSVVVGGLAIGLTFLLPPKFTGEVRMLPPQQAQSTASTLLGSLGGLSGLSGGVSALAGLKNPADQWIGILQSRVIADALIKRFELKDLYRVEYQYEAREELDSRSMIQAGKDGMIQIAVLDEDPQRAADLANAYVEELKKLTQVMALTEAGQRRAFFEQQLKNARDGMVKADRALQEVGVPQGVLKSAPESTLTILGELRARLAALDVRVSVMRTTHSDTSVDLKAALQEQSELRSQLAQMERGGLFGSASVRAEAYIDALRNVKYFETLFEIMARQYELARADEARDGALIQVVDEAVAAERKSSPKRALIGVVAGGLAFVCSVFVVLLRARRRLLA